MLLNSGNTSNSTQEFFIMLFFIELGIEFEHAQNHVLGESHNTKYNKVGKWLFKVYSKVSPLCGSLYCNEELV